MQLIKKYKDLKYDLCNTSDGGDGVRGLSGKQSYWYGRKRSKETCEKISRSKMGHKISEETKKKMSQFQKGRKKKNKAGYYGNTNRVGKKAGEEQKKIQSQRMLNNNFSKRRAVVCVNNGKVYESVIEACRKLKLDNRSVHRVLKGEYKHTKGYFFTYL